MNEKEFAGFITRIFGTIRKNEEVSFKERKTITGKRFLLSASPSILSYNIFINLYFSFRERVLKPKKSTIQTEFPVIFTSFVYHLSKEEIFAEKIRALFSRKKGRDLYDLWHLAAQNVKIENVLIQEKLRYYGIKNKSKKDILKKINEFSQKDFIL